MDPTSNIETKLLQQVTDALRLEMEPYYKRLKQDFERLKALVSLSIELRTPPITLAEQIDVAESSDDVLRAAVVLAHAHLEEFLRTLAAIFLPIANEQVLNGIPLAGTTQTGRPEKFFLGRLLRHKGKLVDEVIRESVEAYLDKSTFNSVTEIVSFLRAMGLELSVDQDVLKDVEEMIERRHAIVHRGDRLKIESLGDSKLQPIPSRDVLRWISASQLLLLNLVPTAFMKQLNVEEFVKKYTLPVKIKNE